MSDFFKKHVVWFIIFAVIVSAVTFGMMQRANRNLAENHRVIVENQNKSAALVDSLMGIRILLANDSAKFIPAHVDRLSNSLEDAISTLDAHQNNARIGNLLELEFSKIQNEYEVLNLWCALLTIVFLIFSFFSIFKTNEMSNQSEAALEGMRQNAHDVQTKSDKIDHDIREANTKISQFQTSISTLETQRTSLSTQFESLEKNSLKKLSEDVDAEQKKVDNLKSERTRLLEELNKELLDKKNELSAEVSKYIAGLRELIEVSIAEAHSRQAGDVLKRVAALESDYKFIAKEMETLFAEEKKEDHDPSETDEIDDSEKDIQDEDERGDLHDNG